MKRRTILLGVLILGLQTVVFSVNNNRERREPCAPYDNERTLPEVVEYITSDGVYWDNYRYELARVYNSIATHRVSATKDGIREMIDNHCVLVEGSFVNPEDYENGVKVGDHILYTDLLGRESKYWLAAVDDNGNIIDVFMKVNCLNIQKRKHILSFDKEKLREAVVIDTIRKTTYIYDTIYHIEYLPYQAEPEPMFAVMLNMNMDMGYQQTYYAPCQPIFYGESGGDFTNIVNNYTYNNTTNNYYKPSKPEPDPETPGGPVDPPGHTDGPAPAPGHDDKSASGQNGGSPRNVPSSNYEETFTNKARSLERPTASNDDAFASTSRNRASNENKNPNLNARSTSPQTNDYEKEWGKKNQERVTTPTSNTGSSSPAPKRESVTDFGQGNELKKIFPPNGDYAPDKFDSRDGSNNQSITKPASVSNGRAQKGVPKTTHTTYPRANNQGNPSTTDGRGSAKPAPTRPPDYNRPAPQKKVDPPRNQYSPKYQQPQRSSRFSPKVTPSRSSSGVGHSYSPSRGSGSSKSSFNSHRGGRGRR